MSGRLLTATALIGLAALNGCAANTNSQTALRAPASVNAGIIGGAESDGKEDFAKTVVLLYDKTLGAMCTASILSDKTLITAAHCVSGEATSLYVVFGTDISSTDILVRRVVVTAVTPVWDARASEELNNGDMAMVGFVGGLPAGYKPAKLLTDVSQLKDGEAVVLAGYGTSDGVAGTGAGKLRYVETTIEKAGYSDSEVLIEQRNGKGACHGDSGGPAYVTVNGEKMVFGVTSRGVNDPENHCGVSAAYTSAPYYKTWIDSQQTKLSAAVDQWTEALKKAEQEKKNSDAASQNIAKAI